MALGYSTLIKYSLWALLIILCTWFVWHVAGNIHDNIFDDGRTAERVVWQEKEAKRSEELARAVADAAKAMAAEREKEVDGLTGALNNETRAKDKLTRDLNDVRNANRGMWITAKSCADNSDGATKEVAGTGISGGGTDRIRLPGQVEQGLWELVADAQRVVIQYETCRRTLAPLIDPVPP